MYCLTTYREPDLVIANLEGRFAEEEAHGVCRDLDRRLMKRDGASGLLLLDLSRFEAQGDAVLALIDRYIERSVQGGIRVGRVVESRLAAHQLDRVAEEAGLLHRIRNFAQRDAALEWLGAPVG